MNFRLRKAGKGISIIIHNAPLGESSKFADTNLVISCQYQEFSPYTPGYIIISYLEEMRTSKSEDKIKQYSEKWHSGNEPFSRAKRDLLKTVRKFFKNIPAGFTEIVDEFLSIIHEDRRRGELKEHIRFMLNISDQKEIESMIRAEVAEQIMKS
jgi:hypothetical protein